MRAAEGRRAPNYEKILKKLLQIVAHLELLLPAGKQWERRAQFTDLVVRSIGKFVLFSVIGVVWRSLPQVVYPVSDVIFQCLSSKL